MQNDRSGPRDCTSSPALNDRHLAELRASGISDTVITASGIRSVDTREAHEILSWRAGPSSRDMSGFAIPFYSNCLAAGAYTRIKPDNPRTNGDGKPVKYESPRGKSNRAFFPPTFRDVLPTARTVLITEGEKKSLSAMSHDFPCIGLVGVWGWQMKRKQTDSGRKYGRRELIADLAAIDWKARNVCIIFDSDAVTNEMVRMAEYKLAEVLQRAGASVRVARIPPVIEGKTGLDDFLVRYGEQGPAKLQELIDEANEAEAPPKQNCMDWAKRYLEEQHTTGKGTTIRWWRDEFWLWDGRRYKAMPNAEIRAVALRWLDETGGPPKPRFAADVVNCLASLCRVRFAFDQPAYLCEPEPEHRNWLAMQNGVLDLDGVRAEGSLAVLPHTPKWFTTIALPYGYSPGATCPVWFQTLHEILSGDRQLVDLLGEFFGYCITEDTSQHAILLLEGPPRSGKGTISRTLEQVVGQDNCVCPRLMALGETFGLWGLVGKRVAICPDAHLGYGDKARAVMETLKLISGEDSIEVHRKHLPSITTRLRVRFVLAVNELPKFGDSSVALAKRAVIVPLRNSFLGREDRQLEGKIARELSGIFNWALEGLERLKRNGRFTQPAVSEELLEEFEQLISPLKAFLDECCLVEQNADVQRDDLWQAWGMWCQLNGHAKGSRESLGTRLRPLVPNLTDSQRRGKDRQRKWCYVGLNLVDGECERLKLAVTAGTGGTGSSLY